MGYTRKTELPGLAAVLTAGLASLLTAVIVAVIVIAFSFSAYAAVYVESPWIFDIKNGTVTITGYTGEGGEVIVPWSIADMEVKRIEGSAFSPLSDVTSIKVPDNYVDTNFGSLQEYVKVEKYRLADIAPLPGQPQNPEDGLDTEGKKETPPADNPGVPDEHTIPLPGDMTNKEISELDQVTSGIPEENQQPRTESSESGKRETVDTEHKDVEVDWQESSSEAHAAVTVNEAGTGTNVKGRGRAAGGGSTAAGMSELVVGAPDVDFELKELPMKEVAVSPMEDQDVDLFVDADGESMDVFDVAEAKAAKAAADGAVEGSASGGNTGGVRIIEADSTDKAAESVPETGEKSALDGVASSANKTAAVIIAVCLAVIAVAGGVCIFIRRK